MELAFAKSRTNDLSVVGNAALDTFLSKIFADRLMNIWILIIVSLTNVTPCVPAVVSGKEVQGLTDTGFRCLKVLLEQGSPFPNQITRFQHLRLLTGAYILGCIVISNGYKNTNIYTMIILREPLKHESFHELVDANFMIYTRSSKMNF